MNGHETPQGPAQPQASGASAGAATAAVARTTGNSGPLDALVAQLQQLVAQTAVAEPTQSADQSWGILRRMFLVSGAIVLVAVSIGVIGVNIWHRNSSHSTGDTTVSGTLVYSTGDAIVSGTLVTISPALPGTVDAVFAHVGSKVQAGDTIAILKTIPGAIMHAKARSPAPSSTRPPPRRRCSAPAHRSPG